MAIMALVCFLQGSVEALNGLGWYYSTIVKDRRKAIEYFEMAAQNGSRDGLFNIGVYQLNGFNPDKPDRNEVSGCKFNLHSRVKWLSFTHPHVLFCLHSSK